MEQLHNNSMPLLVFINFDYGISLIAILLIDEINDDFIILI